MKTGYTSGKKNFVFAFHSVCTVFVPFKMEHFQSLLTVRDLHNYKGVPYGVFILSELNFIRIPFQVVQNIDCIVINLLIPDFQNTIIALLKR